MTSHSSLNISDEVPDVVEEITYFPYRVFFNNVNEYNPRHIAAYLTDQSYGAYKAQILAAGEAGGEGGGGAGEEEDEDQPAKPKDKSFLLTASAYEVIGTQNANAQRLTEDVKYAISDEDREAFMAEILMCGFVVYDISRDPAEIPKALETLEAIQKEIEDVQEIGPKTFDKLQPMRVFILISTVMTWAKTKPIDPDEPGLPFNESDYKKRKPHPNYKEQIACERTVVLAGRKYKDKLRTYVICTGFPYGYEQHDFSFLFKMAWKNEKYLPVFQPGTNYIPVIHIDDLARVLLALMELMPKKPQYILAVEQTPSKLKQIVKALSRMMGPNRIRDVAKEAAFLYSNMTQDLYDRYTVNLNMEPAMIVDDLSVEFKNDLNLYENMKNVVDEFRNFLNLRPIKILMHGPPASGKTNLAKQISDVYGLRYISVKSMIDEMREDLKDRIEEEIEKDKAKKEKLKSGAPAAEETIDEGGEEAEEEEESMLEELQEKLRDIEVTLESNAAHRLPDDHVIRLMRQFLGENCCQNQGYILDGFPKNMTQVKELFGMVSEGPGGEEGGGEDEDEDVGVEKYTIMPNVVISLEATDEFLCNRVMNLPEKEVYNTHYTEEHMLRRLKEYRADNTEDNTILNFFDEHEIHPIIVDVMLDDTKDMATIFEQIQRALGNPVGFPLTPEEYQQLMECRRNTDALREEEKHIQEEIEEQQALDYYQLKMEEKINLLTELQLEEEKLLAIQCEPLRTYLMRFIFPTLTEALLEVAKVKPSDPVDYLAEYLFKYNPEGRMFDPAYTRQGEVVERVVKQDFSDLL